MGEYMSKLTLFFWVMKCVAELMLLHTCITRRVKTIWVLAAYTFWSTLGLMLTYNYAGYKTYFTMNEWVNLLGTLVMIYVFVDLMFRSIQEEKGYRGILYPYVALLGSQYLCQIFNKNFPYSHLIGWFNILSWMVCILLIYISCHRFPRSVMWIKTVDFMTLTIVSPHQSVLIPPDYKRGQVCGETCDR